MTAVYSLARREFSSYFNTPVAYVVLGFYLVASASVFFLIGGFFAMGEASMRTFFDWAPIWFVFLGPAVTMRLIAEERKSGTLELLMTLPVTEAQVVVGKFLGALAMVCVGILFTLAFPLTVSTLVADGHSFAWGPVMGGYLGMVFLAATFISAGMWASALSSNQIVGFIVGVSICFLLVILQPAAVFLPASFVEPVTYLSPMHHFENISRGVIDLRDIVYYLSATAVGLTLTVGALRAAKQ